MTRMSTVEFSFLRRELQRHTVTLERDALVLAVQRLIAEVDALSAEVVRKRAIVERLEERKAAP